LGDIFSSFGMDSGIFSGRRRRGPQPGSSIQVEVEVTLKEVAEGTDKKIIIKRKDYCKTCKGTGAKPGTKKEVCPACNGEGKIRYSQGFFTITKTCQRCHGEGKIIKEPCPECHGTGKQIVEKKIVVHIPKGAEDGMRLKIPEEGNVGEKGAPRGNLYVLISVKPHSLFKRRGADLLIEMPIGFPEAALGTQISVPTLNGKVKMKIAEGTQSNKVFRLKGKGLPSLRGYGQGDEYVKIIVETPTNLSKKQKELLERFSESESEKQRPLHKSFIEKVKKTLGA
jgi:molecular chaperone DnaJ